MKERGILFKTEMVKAILEGRKSMTRRICKKPDFEAVNAASARLEEPPVWFDIYDFEGHCLRMKSPYGKKGDLLWVKETFADDLVADGEGEKMITYKTDFPDMKGCWKSSLFMPKEAARIWLEITDIKVERLQDISDKDAIAEGVKYVVDKITGYCGYDYIHGGYNLMTTPYHGFRSLWKLINGEQSWNDNPFLWVISFKVLSTTGKPGKMNIVPGVQVCDATGVK